MDGQTDGRTDAMLIAISPEPIGRGIIKGHNAKSKKGRVVILVRDTPSGPAAFLPSAIEIIQRVF